MNFSEALQAMKNGKKVKRRIWGGYCSNGLDVCEVTYGKHIKRRF